MATEETRAPAPNPGRTFELHEDFTMRSESTILVAMLLLLALVVPASAGLFGPTTETFKGRVNFLQQTNFTLLTDNNQLVRILVARDKRVPAEVQLGVLVEVTAVLGTDRQWYLDKFEKIQLQPNQ
jgi:hypothetical protein